MQKGLYLNMVKKNQSTTASKSQTLIESQHSMQMRAVMIVMSPIQSIETSCSKLHLAVPAVRNLEIVPPQGIKTTNQRETATSSRRFSKHFPNQVFMGFSSKLQLAESQHSEVPGRSLSTSRQKRSTKLRQKLAAMAKFCPIASNIRLIAVAVGTTKSASPRACHHCKGYARNNSDKTTTYSGSKHTSY